MDLRKYPIVFKHNLKEFGQSHLEHCYAELVQVLNKKYKPELQRTYFEDVLYKLIKGTTRLEIHRSFWIGRRNIDIFIPAVKANKLTEKVQNFKFNGIAIEVDGGIHNEYFKMKKDQSKLEFLHSLSICSIIIENQDINHPLVKELLFHLSEYRNKDFRSKQRLLRNIYLKTLMAHKELIQEYKLNASISLLKSIGEL